MRSAETNRIDMGIFIHIDLLVSAMNKKEFISETHKLDVRFNIHIVKMIKEAKVSLIITKATLPAITSSNGTSSKNEVEAEVTGSRPNGLEISYTHFYRTRNFNLNYNSLVGVGVGVGV